MSRHKTLAAVKTIAVAAVAATMLAPAFTVQRWTSDSTILPLHRTLQAGPQATPLISNSATSTSTSSLPLLALSATAAAALRSLGRKKRQQPSVHSSAVEVRPSSFAGLQPELQSLPFATHGAGESTCTGRASRIVAYKWRTNFFTEAYEEKLAKFKRKDTRVEKRWPRIPRLYAKERRREVWMKYSQTFWNRRRNCHRIAKQAVMDALKKKYKSRRLFKRERRTLWIQRVNANARLHGIAYCHLIQNLKEVNINLNRKMLSQLGVYDRSIFTNILEVAVPEWKDRVAKRNYVRPAYTTEELDNYAIPYLEKVVPEIYTDDTIRFNRKVHEWGVEYTVDMGNPELWREMLPKMPEWANFNLPEHWMGNSNAEFENLPLEMLNTPPHLESKDYIKFMEKVKKTQAEDEENAKKGLPTWPKKEGVSREDWFKEEPQSWFD